MHGAKASRFVKEFLESTFEECDYTGRSKWVRTVLNQCMSSRADVEGKLSSAAMLQQNWNQLRLDVSYEEWNLKASGQGRSLGVFCTDSCTVHISFTMVL